MKQALIGTGLILFSITGWAATVSLPVPVDVPPGPAGAAGPGGGGLPVLVGKAPADAPAISMISDVTLPDETLVITGDKLDGAKLRVWAEGIVRDLEPLRTANNRMQAVAPKEFPASTMLVWPVKDGKIGAPIRVNGATAWWGWPPRLTVEEASESQTVRIMGKNLKLGETPPRMYVQGPGVAQWLKVKEANPYCLDAELPEGLKAGRYQVWAHNGTGGPYGWSDPVALEVIEAPSQRNLPTFRVDDFGANPNDGADDASAIQAAVDAAAKAGGGIVSFSAGTYRVGKSIETPAGASAGVHFVGAGMGQHNSENHALSGSYTALCFVDGMAPPSAIVRLKSRFDSVRDLTLVNGNDGMERGINQRDVMGQVVACAYAHDLSFERVRFVLLDRRPEAPEEQRRDLQLFDPALHVDAAGIANILIRDCEFHSAGTGIEIGMLQPGHTDSDPPAPSSDCVRVERCVFRCYSRGFYKTPGTQRGYNTMGARNSGVMNENGKNLIVERCDFAGADRRGGKMMNRSICSYNTSIRQTYIANNNSHDVGMVCPPEDRRVNQGEQILFHFRYPHGGYFDVVEAGPQSVVVNPDDPRNKAKLKSPHHVADRAGSRVLDEVGANDHWIVFVAAGKGVGQYRVVIGRKDAEGRVTLQLDRPWRVAPDSTSRITLTTAFRQNIIFNNTVDAGFIDPRSKVAGVLFWYNAFDNVVAGCTLRHVGYGVGFNSSFRNPCCWNLVRDNVAEHVGGMSVECIAPVCYMQTCGATDGPTGPLFRTGSDVHGWYAVGNVFRSNRGADAPVAVIAHASLRDDLAKKLPPQDDGGLVMAVIENSQFSGVEKGILVNPGCCWAVIRNNVVKTTDPAAPAVWDQSGGNTLNALILESKGER